VQFGLLSQLMFLEIRQIFFTALKSDLRDSRHAAADAIIIPNTAGNISTTVYMTYMLFYCHINGKTKAPLNDWIDSYQSISLLRTRQHNRIPQKERI